MNTNNHTIDLNITLTAPLHLAYPDNSVALNPEKPKKKTSLTVKKPVLIGGDLTQVPFFPANGTRGGLRRKAAARVMKYLTAQARVPSSLYLGLTCGAATGSPDSTALSVEELLRARQNVYMGMFGGGARLLSSAYKVSDLNPVLDLTVKAGMVPEYCKEIVQPRRSKDGKENEVSFLEPWQIVKGILSMVRVDDVARMMRPDEIMEFVESPKESVAAHQEAILVNNDDRKEGTASKESLANMMATETVATGTPMHMRITCAPSTSEAQMGLLLYALNDLIRENSLGGLSSQGFGTFRVDAIHVKLGDSLGCENVKALDLGSGEDFKLPSNATVSRLLQAADQGLSELSIEEMQSYFYDFSADAKAEAKAAKKSKATKES